MSDLYYVMSVVTRKVGYGRLKVRQN